MSTKIKKQPYLRKPEPVFTPKTRVTLAKLARYCELSKSTVSRILNHRFGEFPVSPETIAMVFKASKELGYRRNRLARAIASQRTHLVGLSIPMLPVQEKNSGLFFTPISHHFISAVFAHPLFSSYDLVIHKRDRQMDLNDSDDLLDGLLYVDPEGRSRDFLRAISQLFPLVVLGTVDDSESWLVTVDVNNRSIGEKAAAHLFERGARQLLMITPSDYAAFACIKQREKGFLDGVWQIGLPKSKGVSLHSDDSVEAYQNVLRPFLKEEEKIGVFLPVDHMYNPFIEALRQEGVCSQDKAAVIFIGNGNTAANIQPTPINPSIFEVPLFDITAKATDLLLKVLDNQTPYVPGFYEVEGHLLTKDSSRS